MATVSPAKLKQQSKSYSTLNFHKESGSTLLFDSMYQSQAKSKEKPLNDDIVAEEWLTDIGFPQYTETFLTNLSYDGKILLRRRLATVRIQDLSKMNIINFDHQKQLMNHINYILKNPFSTILRQRQLQQQQQLKEVEETAKSSPAKPNQPNSPLPTHGASAKSYLDEKKESQSSRDSSLPPSGARAAAKEIIDNIPAIQTNLNSNGTNSNNRSRRNSANNLLKEGSILSADSKTEPAEDGKDQKDGKESSTPVVKTAMTAQEKAAKRKETEKRRKSFDSQVWNTISSMRNKQSDIASAAENLRSGIATNPSLSHSADSKEGIPPEPSVNPSTLATPLASEKSNGKRSHRRRWSFGSPENAPEESFSTNKERAQAYGNMALEYDMMITSLKSLQNEILFKFRQIMSCEKASIFFINELTRELILFADDGKWYRLPSGSGIAGWCVEYGETLNIPDAYADHRFNKNIDIKTGFRTRNILAKPVRRQRGGGNIVAVIEMINKADGQDFTSEDEDMLTSCVENVADVLSNRFQELMNAGERFSGSATFIMGRATSQLNNGSAASGLSLEIGEEGKDEQSGPGKVRFKSP